MPAPSASRHPAGPPPRFGYHATTLRAASLIQDGEGIDPEMSERFEHVFIFETLEATLRYINDYPANFADTGAVIFEINLAGLALTPDPQRPPLPGAWRTTELIGRERLLGLIELVPYRYPPVISRRYALG